jgi:hypothetical protein
VPNSAVNFKPQMLKAAFSVGVFIVLLVLGACPQQRKVCRWIGGVFFSWGEMALHLGQVAIQGLRDLAGAHAAGMQGLDHPRLTFG